MHNDTRRHLPPLPPHRLRLIHLVTLAVLLLGLLLSWQAGSLSRQRGLTERQAQVQSRLADFRAHLETRLYSSLAQLRGLSANLVLRESLTPEEFARVAEELRMGDPYLLSLGLAPGFKVDQVYPARMGDRFVGLDLLKSAQYKPPLLSAIQLDNAVLAGPGQGLQGKPVLTCLLPVWVARDGVPRLWGATVLNLDFAALLDDSGLKTLENELYVEIRGRDAMGPAGATVYGDAASMGFHAVRMPAFVPGGSWLIAGMPREGWQVAPWWRTQAGLLGLVLTALSTLAVFVILRDRLRIRTLAGVDPLTALPNRRIAMARLHQLIARNRKHDRAFAVFSIDLDGFKPINDRHGHAAGDAVLAAIGQRLRQSIRGNDLIARVGGDEFLLLLDDPTASNDERLLVYAQRIRKALLDPIHDGGTELRIGASIGVASFPRDGTDAAALLREADAAMYRAKRDREDGVELARVRAAS
jgi:diguanylate cyclase (GGDEF)-like protein